MSRVIWFYMNIIFSFRQNKIMKYNIDLKMEFLEKKLELCKLNDLDTELDKMLKLNKHYNGRNLS